MSISARLTNYAGSYYDHVARHASGVLEKTANHVAHSAYGVYLEPLKVNFSLIAGFCLTGKMLAKRAYSLKPKEALLPLAHQKEESSGWFVAKKVALYAGSLLCFGLAAYELYHTVSEYYVIGKSAVCKGLEDSIAQELSDIEKYRKLEVIESEKMRAHYAKYSSDAIAPAFVTWNYNWEIASAKEMLQKLQKTSLESGCTHEL